jgi:hypothetical protein
MPNQTLNIDGPLAIGEIPPSSPPSGSSDWGKLYTTHANVGGEIRKALYWNPAYLPIAGPHSASPRLLMTNSPWGLYSSATYGYITVKLSAANDRASLSGAAAKSGPGSNVLLTLPDEYRPTARREFVCPAGLDGAPRPVRISVDPGGDIAWTYTYGVGAPGTGDMLDYVILTPVRWNID